jgi:hypothetical protein
MLAARRGPQNGFSVLTRRLGYVRPTPLRLHRGHVEIIGLIRNVGIGVDVHVHRITNRLKWHKQPTKNPEETR